MSEMAIDAEFSRSLSIKTGHLGSTSYDAINDMNMKPFTRPLLGSAHVRVDDRT